jgi:hypothetical protein
VCDADPMVPALCLLKDDCLGGGREIVMFVFNGEAQRRALGQHGFSSTGRTYGVFLDVSPFC